MVKLPDLSSLKAKKRAQIYQALIQKEAEIGGKLFGPIEAGSTRQFYCLDELTWIWHEDFRGSSDTNRDLTIRYEVHPSGIFKIENGKNYPLDKVEFERFYRATQTYRQHVNTMLYNAV